MIGPVQEYAYSLLLIKNIRQPPAIALMNSRHLKVVQYNDGNDCIVKCMRVCWALSEFALVHECSDLIKLGHVYCASWTFQRTHHLGLRSPAALFISCFVSQNFQKIVHDIFNPASFRKEQSHIVTATISACLTLPCYIAMHDIGKKRQVIKVLQLDG